MDEKVSAYTNATELGSHGDLTEQQHGNSNQDHVDMQRMGKTQVLRRNFEFFSIVGFVSILQATWECTLLVSSFGLYNGGTAGVIWLTVAVWLGFLAMMASMAEMASMAPTAGGQYHWVSEFAPPTWEKPISYIIGWCCCFGWVTGVPAICQILAGIVEGMVLVAYPDANIGSLWQTTLQTFFWMALTFVVCIFLGKQLPMLERGALVLHVVGFLVILIVLWTMGEHVPAKRVFTEFQDGGGWGSIGLSTLVGIGSPLWFFIGPDAGVHMSEELKDASINLPRAMMYSMLFNGAIGIVMLISFCFCITDINAVLDTPTGQPALAVLHNVTGSVAATCILGTLLAVLQFFGSITNLATSSRQCWAFARDYGFPYSDWLMRIDKRFGLPLNSFYMCAVVSVILACINFGSNVAFNAIVSVSNAALVASYMTSIGCLRLRRLRGQPVLACRWSLGKWGGPINDVALAFLSISFVFSFFPETPVAGDPSWAQDFNWAIVMFAATCLLAFAYYVVRGRHVYVAPVCLVKEQ